MLDVRERPEPNETGNQDDCASQGWKRSSRVVGSAGMAPAWASTPVAAADPTRPSLPAARAQMGMVRPRRSLWERFKAGAGRFADAMGSAFFGTARLSPQLPPLPPIRSNSATRLSVGVVPEQEQGEHMLLFLLLAPPVYQRAAIDVAYRALQMRREGAEAHADFLVQFVLSRMVPDGQGRISTERLRDRLCRLSYAREIAPALVRLEQEGIVALVMSHRDDDPMREMLREDITGVELRVWV
jgi:hypothetical protein